jgi:hypothetical protein
MCCKWVLPQFTKLEMLSGDPHQGVCVCERETQREREILTTIRKKLRRNPSTQKQKQIKRSLQDQKEAPNKKPSLQQQQQHQHMRISHSSPPSLLNTFLSAQQNEEEEEEEEEEYIVLGNFHQQKHQQQQKVCQRTLFIKFFLTCLQKNFLFIKILTMFPKELCSSNSS